jgi:hypothetical protein
VEQVPDSVVGLALALSLFAGCDEKSNGTGPVAGGDFGAAAAALEGVVDDYFTANEPAYRSIDFFGQRIANALGGAPAALGPASSAALLQSCLSPDVTGTTFEWVTAQSAYFPTSLTGAPADGARFLLYEVSSGGTLVTPLNQIGHLDLDCPMTLPDVNLNLKVMIDGVQVLHMFTSPGSFLNPSSLVYQLTIGVDLRTPDGSSQFSIPALGVLGTLGSQRIAGFTVPVVSDVFAGFNRTDDLTTGTFTVLATLYKGFPTSTLEWELTVDLAGTSSGSIAGPAIFMFPIVDGHGGEIEVVACVSGTYENPVVSRPSQQCAVELLELNQDLSDSELQAIGRGYTALRTMLDRLDGIVQIGFGLVTSAIG